MEQAMSIADEIKKATACPKCGLEAKTMLHPFCQYGDCPVRSVFAPAALRHEPPAVEVAALVEREPCRRCKDKGWYYVTVDPDLDRDVPCVCSQCFVPADALASRDAEIRRLRDYGAETAMLGYKWMEAHDCLKLASRLDARSPAICRMHSPRLPPRTARSP